MTTIEIVNALRTEAKTNKVANDVFTVWAMRERSRAEVTLNGLHQRMVREGFNYTKQDYAPFLRTMARLGVGRLETQGGTKVVAIKNVHWKLDSLGKAALGEIGHVRSFRARNRFEPIKTIDVPKAVEKKVEIKPCAPVTLTVSVNGKSLNLPIPNEFTPEDVGALVAQFQR